MTDPVLRSWDGTAWVPPRPTWSLVDLSPSGWWDASQITGLSDGDPVPSWTDLSGSGATAVSLTGPRSPTLKAGGLNGENVLAFTDQQALRVSTGVSKSYTVFAVARLSSLVGRVGRIVTADNSRANWLMGWHGGYEDRAFSGGWVDQGSSATTDWISYAMSSDASNTTLYRDGDTLGSSSAVGGMGDRLFFNTTSPSSVGESSMCEVAEAVLFSTQLAASTRAKVEGYLAWKYQLQASLPADHPYKSAAP